MTTKATYRYRDPQSGELLTTYRFEDVLECKGIDPKKVCRKRRRDTRPARRVFPKGLSGPVADYVRLYRTLNYLTQ